MKEAWGIDQRRQEELERNAVGVFTTSAVDVSFRPACSLRAMAWPHPWEEMEGEDRTRP